MLVYDDLIDDALLAEAQEPQVTAPAVIVVGPVAGLDLTQTANFIGIPRGTASRAVKKLSDWGLILHQGRYYVVPDMQRLSAYCHSGLTD